MCSNTRIHALNNGAYRDNKSLDKHGFFRQVTSCHYSCHKCSFCSNLADNLVKTDLLTQAKLEDLGLAEAAEQMARTGRITLPLSEVSTKKHKRRRLVSGKRLMITI